MPLTFGWPAPRSRCVNVRRRNGLAGEAAELSPAAGAVTGRALEEPAARGRTGATSLTLKGRRHCTAQDLAKE